MNGAQLGGPISLDVETSALTQTILASDSLVTLCFQIWLGAEVVADQNLRDKVYFFIHLEVRGLHGRCFIFHALLVQT